MAAIAEIDAVLPGSVLVRHKRCGKAVCRCRADPPSLHGPYIQWTRTVEGKTVSRYLTTEQLEAFKPWFDNARRLRELVRELEAISVAEVEAALARPRVLRPARARQPAEPVPRPNSGPA